MGLEVIFPTDVLGERVSRARYGSRVVLGLFRCPRVEREGKDHRQRSNGENKAKSNPFHKRKKVNSLMGENNKIER